MTTSVKPQAAPAAPPSELPAAIAWVVSWAKGNRNLAIGLGVALVAGGGLGWWTIVSRNRVEAAASQRLSQGRLALESRNYPLAASELARLVENYSGTKAASEANILMAQVRLAQGQTQQAIDLLNKVAPTLGRDYQSQAYGLLGVSNENAGHLREAATAYETAASHAVYPYQQGQYLSEAGRVWSAAGDTAKALADYHTIISGMDSTQVLTEAKVRVGELTRSAGAP
ncbi:MAG TPA: tetratricopeptide repeat protein [Gemmatimonadales bacterium]|nr:tetratricopeptide repeat protein [Gemmatimonadales bacterium]